MSTPYEPNPAPALASLLPPDGSADPDALRRTARLYESILSNVSDFAYLLDREGRFLFANKALLDLWGLPLEAAVGKTFFELGYPVPLATRLHDEMRQVVETRARVTGETPYTSPTGTPGYYEYIFSPVLAPDGSVEAVAGSTRDVSKRKGEDARARAVLESITDAFVGLDRQWKFTYVNAQAERLLDRKPGELVGRVLWEEYPGMPGTEFERVYRAAMDHGTAGSLTSFYPDHDRWYEVHAYPAPEGISIYFRDITAHKLAEAATRDLTERYEKQSRLFEQISSTTPDFIYVFDRQANFLYANRRLLEVWGVSYDDAVGKTFEAFGYPDWHAAMHRREIAQVIATKKSIKGEVPFTGGSGISGIYEYIFTPVLGSDGEVEVIAGTTRDVTDRRQTDQRLARDGTLLANVLDSVIVTDDAGRVTFWNEGAARVFGWTADEMMGRRLTERLPEASRAPVEEWIRRIADQDDVFSGEWLDSRKDGSPVWIEATTRKIKDPDGRFLGLMGVSRDISVRKTIEAERDQLLSSERAARGDAERASRMKDEFLATLSHELRTPLNAILGWATILAGRATTEPSMKTGLETIQRNARAQTRIIEDLLDMSRIISGKVRLEVQPTDLVQVLQAAVDTVRPTAETKGVRLRAVIDPETGPVTGDPNRLQQVFWNLLVNAVKFTPKGGQVEVTLARVNSHLEVAVADTGEGIAAEFLPYVFDRFRQADASASRRHGGLGIGLAIVKQLVELHGGRVRAVSRGVNEGSVFTVELPPSIVRADPAAEAFARRHPSGTYAVSAQGEVGDEPLLTAVKVVVVDDEPDARALVKRLLEDRGAIVRDAGSADEALALIADAPPDVLVSDIGMPGEDGYGLIRRVRSLAAREGGDVPAVALTAFARTEDRVRAIRAGYQSHVVKPVEARELIAIVASLGRRLAR